jgi:hypothetical protein
VFGTRYSVAIGYKAKVTTDRTVIIGGDSTTRVGINTNDPKPNMLDINAKVRFRSTTYEEGIDNSGIFDIPGFVWLSTSIGKTSFYKIKHSGGQRKLCMPSGEGQVGELAVVQNLFAILNIEHHPDLNAGLNASNIKLKAGGTKQLLAGQLIYMIFDGEFWREL